MADPSNAATPVPPREPSAAVRGDPMLRAVEVVEAAMQLGAAGTGGTSPATPAASPKPATEPPARSTRAGAQELLAKREKEIAAQTTQLQERQRELEGRAKAIQDAVARRAEYSRNPRRLLEETGLSLEDIASTVLNDGTPPPELLARAAQEEVALLREELSERDKRVDQAAAEGKRVERDEARAQVRTMIGDVVAADPDKYELIALHGDEAQDLVYRAMEESYRLGQELSPEEAADKVEAYLDREAERALKTRKLGARLKPPSGAPGTTRSGADPMERAVADLVSRGLTRF